ncbi:unnamed protein product [Clavelina lepadiformis]|uniref:Uncharacterized protein n=1 Tax=Clavelina lepadiformis TaxID=159417 RepID=A0ABP0G4W9_CLALP
MERDDAAIKLMQERLAGAENNTESLAKMLLELGISPTTAANDNRFEQGDGDANNMQPTHTASSHKGFKPGEKSVRFEMSSEAKQKQSQRPSILKKHPIEPLKVNLNTLNMRSNQKGNVPPEEYSKLVSRLCKTESVIQSLKLSLCAMQTSHEAADREKNIVIEKLKEEISELENQVKKQDNEMLMEARKRDDSTRRWEEAEKEVKDLHERLQEQSLKSKQSTGEEEASRAKFSRKLEEVKQEVAREREVRTSIEDSHLALLSRVQDMEETIQQERAQMELYKEEARKFKEKNENLVKETKNFHLKASDLEKTLTSLKEELNAKEEAIRRLIQEQHHNEVESSSITNQQASLLKELKQCNVMLDVQKAALGNLEAENSKLKEQIIEERNRLERKEQSERDKEEEETSRRNEEKLKRKEIEEQHRIELKQTVKNEKKRFRELEERRDLLEQCIREQEKKINEKEEELLEKENEMNERIIAEKKKTAHAVKEKEQAVKARESLMRDLNRATSDVARDKEFLQQQLEEVKLEHEVTSKERQQLEEENQRLLHRITGVEQQEQAYKRAQDLAQASNAAKGQLSYDNGRLQTRVEQLEEELRTVASVQSQVVQLRASNRALEQKYSKLTSELATARVDLQRGNAHMKQLQSGMERKEADFNLAIVARDEAVQDKEAALAQVDVIKEQEKNKQGLLKRDLADCQADNERLTATMHDVATRQAELQSVLDDIQGQLGRKDAHLAALATERNKLDQEANDLRAQVARLQTSLEDRDTDEQSRLTPALEALEKARHDNVRLANSLDDVMNANTALKQDLEKCKIDLEIQRERTNSLVEQQERNDNEAIVTSQTHSDRMKQLKEQFSRERSAIRKQYQAQIAELKKSQDASQSRNCQLTKGNTDLRSRLAERERALTKLKEKLKDQKLQIERYQRDRKTHSNTEQKFKALDVDLNELEKTKQNYMEKNKKQAGIISTFNQEMTSLKDDITALSEAQKIARETTLRLEDEVSKERSEKEILIKKVETMEVAMKRAIRQKQESEEKLRRVEVESMRVHENLQEAQSWFTDKFEKLQNELTHK